jgi:hypothetical protein
MLKWKPHLRLLLVVALLVAFAYTLGWLELANFLEW